MRKQPPQYMHFHAKNDILVARSIGNIQVVKGFVVYSVGAGGGCVVTAATTKHAITMMFAVQNMATSPVVVLLHLMYSSVIHHTTVKLIHSSYFSFSYIRLICL